MNESYLPIRAKVLLADFESAFSNTYDAAQDILNYIDDYYEGNRNDFLNEALHDCDYYTVAQALKVIFDFSEN